MTPSPAFDRAYAHSKALVLEGIWQPGQRVDVAAIADELGTSLTPVRDALYRLLGERLLTGGPNDGFIMPTRTQPDLADLLGWSAALLGLALRTTPIPPLSDTDLLPSTEAIAARTRGLFDSVAQASDNGELAVEMARANDRLHSARLVEPAIFDDLEEEWELLRGSMLRDTPPQIRARLVRYHRRRISAAGKIVRAMHRPTGS